MRVPYHIFTRTKAPLRLLLLMALGTIVGCADQQSEKSAEGDSKILYDFEGESQAIVEAQDATFALTKDGSNSFINSS